MNRSAACAASAAQRDKKRAVCRTSPTTTSAARPAHRRGQRGVRAAGPRKSAGSSWICGLRTASTSQTIRARELARDLERRAFAQVVDVGLERKAEAGRRSAVVCGSGPAPIRWRASTWCGLLSLTRRALFRSRRDSSGGGVNDEPRGRPRCSGRRRPGPAARPCTRGLAIWRAESIPRH